MPKKASSHKHIEEEESEEEDDPRQAEILARLTDPNYSAKFVAGLAPKVRDRVRALQALQKKYNEYFSEYQKELAILDKKYESEYRPLQDYRREIVAGLKEPEDEEVKRGFPEDHAGHVSLEEGERTDVKGIPCFWLRAFKNNRRIESTITERDEACLSHLIDVQCSLMDNPIEGFVLTFMFSENEFFENTILTKEYKLIEEDGEMVLDHATGTEIKWKKGNNLTVEEKRKKQRSKKTKEVRYVVTTEPCDSFFKFFSPPQMKESVDGEEAPDPEDDDEFDVGERIEDDYEQGQIIRERIIMRAVEYFTGEADSGSDDDDDDYEDGDEEEEEEEEVMPRGKRGGRSNKGHGSSGAHGRGGGGQQECKQQ